MYNSPSSILMSSVHFVAILCMEMSHTQVYTFPSFECFAEWMRAFYFCDWTPHRERRLCPTPCCPPATIGTHANRDILLEKKFEKLTYVRTRTVVFCFLYFEEKEKSPLLRHSIGSVHLFHPYQRNCVFHFVRFYQLLFARLSVVSGHSYFHSLSLSALSFSLSLSVFSVFLLFFILNHWFFYDSVNHLHNFLSYVLPSPAKTNGKEK